MPRTKNSPAEQAGTDQEIEPTEAELDQTDDGPQLAVVDPDEDEDTEDNEEWEDEDDGSDDDNEDEDWDGDEVVSANVASQPAAAATTKEHDTLAEIASAEQRCNATESRVRILRENLKDAKKEYDGHVIMLRTLCRALKNDGDWPLFSQPKAATNGELANGVVESIKAAADATKAATDQMAEPVSENAWRAVPLIEMPLEGIKGLGPKKIEVLVRACPNMGEFEDLRGGKGLTSLEGIGESMASELENRMMEWLTKNRDSAVIAAARGETIEAETGTEVAASETIEHAAEPQPSVDLDDL